MKVRTPGKRTLLLAPLAGAAALAGCVLYVWRRLRKGATEGSGSADDVSLGLVKDTRAPALETVPVTGSSHSKADATRPLEEVKDLGAVHAERLAGLGMITFDDLLTAGAGPKGRQDLASATGVDTTLVLRWVNQVDLCRVDGIGPKYADLLEASGVDTVPELARRRADNLTKKLSEVNEEKKLVRDVPTESTVAGWIEFAKTLDRVVEY